MSGHSKWSKIKHKKEINDAQKGKLFSKLSKEITLAVIEGGIADIKHNFLLKIAVEKAKKLKMPSINIDRAIQCAVSKGNGCYLERFIYEAYGPNGLAIIIEVVTDNKNRTISEIRNILSVNNCRLAESGSVLWQFDKRGLLSLSSNMLEDQVIENLIDIEGIIDVNVSNCNINVIVESNKLNECKQYIENRGFIVDMSEFTYIPKNPVNISLNVVRSLVAAIEEQSDVLNIWTNVCNEQFNRKV